MKYTDVRWICLAIAPLLALALGCMASPRTPGPAPAAPYSARRAPATIQGTASDGRNAPDGEERSGLGEADEAGRAGPRSAASREPDSVALADVLRQLDGIDLSPDAKERLFADLEQTDPALWPQLVTAIKAGAEYRKKEKGSKSGERQPESLAEADGPQPRQPANRLSAVFDDPPAAEPRKAASVQGRRPDAVQASPSRKEIVAEPARKDYPPETAQSVKPPASKQEESAEASQSVAITDLPRKPNADSGDGAKSKPVSPVAPASFEEPVGGGSAKDWREQLRSLVVQLEGQSRSAAANRPDPRDEIALRLLYALDGRREDALRPIAGLAPAEQDFWAKELYGLTALLQSDGPDGDARAAEAAMHLADATVRLRDAAALLVRNLAFCTEVNSYGVYKTFDKYEFHPGQEVLLYAEVENFKSEVLPDGYKTVLSSRYQLFDKQGKQVEERDFGVTEETCRNRRRDFFIRYQFALPHRIYDGAYTLKLTVEDAQGQKLGQSAIDLSIKEAKH